MIYRKKVLAPAKINLFFEANYLYPDGYHSITSVMQTVSLCDSIDIELLEHNSDINVTVNNMPRLSGAANIAYPAAESFLDNVKVENCGVNIRIDKKIPLLSGLGGGSADAAAVLWGLNKMFDNPLTPQELIAIGKQIGADVPFCIIGGTALVGGIGEEIQPCPQIPDCYIVIVKFGEKKSTKDMYKKLDDIKGRGIRTGSAILSAIDHSDLKGIASNLYNAFSESYKQDNVIAQHFSDFGALGHCLSGSGPSQFAIFDSLSAAQKATNFFSEEGIESYLTIPAKSKQ